ncbi:paraquat-inducible protein A [Minwuia sp.]|uniref:paraquat-inducible protein A n=1 Tax=Minwuia sp. TaxID=2493630 RepID=UPI003A95AE8F
MPETTHAPRFALLLAALFSIGIVALSVLLSLESRQLSQWETDRAELHNIRYGALDSEQWVSRVAPILADRIRAFEITPEQRPRLKAVLTSLIERLIDEVPKHLNPLGDNTGEIGRIFGGATNLLGGLTIDVLGLRKKAPELAEALIDELQKPDTRKQMVALMHDALSDFAIENMPPADKQAITAIKSAYGCSTVPACETVLGQKIERSSDQTLMYLLALAGLAVVMLFLCRGLMLRLPAHTGLLLSLAALGLLAAGLLAPMIQIDARITSLDVQVLGETIGFQNQVVYFQSKSILDVVAVLARAGAPDLLLVAALIALFSIGFPLLKLLTSLRVTFARADAPLGRLTRFFAFQSSKWAMADVFVVALFMAFLGMRGLVADQLGGLEGQREAVTILTTNGTSLEPGFWAFLMFALFGVTMGILVQRWRARP